MRYRTSWIDLKYEAAFRLPLFAVSASPLKFVEAMCASLRLVVTIAARDISITQQSDVDTRVIAKFFNNKANLEVGPDSLSMFFTDPRSRDDFDVIKKSVKAMHAFLHEQAQMTLPKDETVTVRAFLALVDEPKNAREHLRSICGDSKLYTQSMVAKDSAISPGIRFDIEDARDMWSFNFELSRAVRNPREVFVLTTTLFPAETKVTDTDARAALIDHLVTEAMQRVGLESEQLSPNASGTSSG